MKDVSTSKAYASGYKKSDIILDLLKEVTRLFISPEELREFWYFRSPLSFQKQVTQGLRGTSTVERFRAKALKLHRAQFTCPATTLPGLTFCPPSLCTLQQKTTESTHLLELFKGRWARHSLHCLAYVSCSSFWGFYMIMSQFNQVRRTITMELIGPLKTGIRGRIGLWTHIVYFMLYHFKSTLILTWRAKGKLMVISTW